MLRTAQRGGVSNLVSLRNWRRSLEQTVHRRMHRRKFWNARRMGRCSNEHGYENQILRDSENTNIKNHIGLLQV